MEFTQLATSPVPIWLGMLDANDDARRCPVDGVDLRHLDRDLATCAFRAVDAERLPRILATGIDVAPSDSVIYADYLDKAWEYGGLPKVVVALQRSALERTYREVSADLSADELAEVTARFPTVIPADDGKLWCSRMDANDPRVGSPYELAYAWWIPGDPFDALSAVVLFARPQDLEAIQAVLASR